VSVEGGGGASDGASAIDDFSPEAIVESSALEEPTAADFLHQNYPDFFGEVEDLADAAGYLSDANTIADAYRRARWQTSLLGYISSVAGRGVTAVNQHPTYSRSLRAIRKPQVYAVDRQVTERKQRAAAAFHQVVDGCSGVDRLCGPSELVSELLPYLRLVIAPSGAPNRTDGVRLSTEQSRVVSELTTFTTGRRAPLPVPMVVGLPEARSSKVPGGVGQLRGQLADASLPAVLEDDIEDDDAS